MTKQLKFVDGVYGFVYDSIHGYVSKTFHEPISELELKAMYRVLNDDDLLFVRGDEASIIEMWELNDESDLNELDINEDVTILEWAN